MNNLINLVIYDSDKEYIQSFNEYLKGYDRKSFEMNFFTDISSLEEYCADIRIDLIIVAEYLIPVLVNSDFIKEYSDKIIVLGDEKDITHIDDFLTVYRYQAADALISDILNICAERTEDRLQNVRYLRTKNIVVAGIYSPVNRCGKTRFSIELSKRMSEKGRRVLLLNLEEFSSFDKYIGSDTGSNLSDLLFYYLGGKGCFEVKSEAIIKSYCNFDYVLPVQCIYDLRNLDSEVWNTFISDLGKIRGYEYIIVDISNMVKDYFALMERMNVIFLPYLEDEYSRFKVNRMKSFIEGSEHKELINKFSELGMDNFIKGHDCRIVEDASEVMERLMKEEEDWSR